MARQTRVDAGRRDRRMTIQYRAVTDAIDADSGEPIETWLTLVASMPMARKDAQGREYLAAQRQPSASVEVRWEMAYRSDMDPEVIDVPKVRRLLDGARVYDITAASVIGVRRGIEVWTLASMAVS